MNPLVQSSMTTTPSVWLVCILGVFVVFVGLVAIIVLVQLMNRACDLLQRRKKPDKAVVPASPAPVAAVTEPIPNREELVAAVCAVIAEEEGVDVSALRVLSLKKL